MEKRKTAVKTGAGCSWKLYPNFYLTLSNGGKYYDFLFNFYRTRFSPGLISPGEHRRKKQRYNEIPILLFLPAI